MKSNSEVFASINEIYTFPQEQQGKLLAKLAFSIALDCRDLLSQIVENQKTALLSKGA
jgi:hypothetical protein